MLDADHRFDQRGRTVDPAMLGLRLVADACDEVPGEPVAPIDRSRKTRAAGTADRRSCPARAFGCQNAGVEHLALDEMCAQQRVGGRLRLDERRHVGARRGSRLRIFCQIGADPLVNDGGVIREFRIDGPSKTFIRDLLTQLAVCLCRRHVMLPIFWLELSLIEMCVRGRSDTASHAGRAPLQARCRHDVGWSSSRRPRGLR